MNTVKPERVWITECPRDAMQGIRDFIPTEDKAAYLNALLKVGFDYLDFGSFVSPKAIPQLRDTEKVLGLLDLDHSATKLLAIVANERGVEAAAGFAQVHTLGFPFSISETFQQRNTRSGIAESFETVRKMVLHCQSTHKEPLVYLSMAYGNPYGDPWNADIALGWMERLYELGVRRFALADTVGIAGPETVYEVTANALQGMGDRAEVGVHLHCLPENWESKVEAAFRAGCRSFDAAMRGFGGCPMAKNELIGNLATEKLIQYLEKKNVVTGIRQTQFAAAFEAAAPVFMAHS